MALENVEPLEGWILLADAARELSCSRMALYDAVSAGKVKTARKLGTTRPVYVMRTAELPDVRLILSKSRQYQAVLESRRRHSEIQDDTPSGDTNPVHTTHTDGTWCRNGVSHWEPCDWPGGDTSTGADNPG